jgi:hypothetical protein
MIQDIIHGLGVLHKHRWNIFHNKCSLICMSELPQDFYNKILEEYLQQKDNSGTLHVNISHRLESLCHVFTAIKH